MMAPPTATVVVNNSTLNGAAFTQAGSTSLVTLENNSVWNLTGSSNLSSLTNSLSTIDFVANGNNFKTLTVNDYVGQSGAINLNTFLGGDTSPSDQLIVDGGAATGSTALSIRNTTGLGTLTLGDGILVVDAINGATTDTAAFSLSGPVIAGPYEYSLYRSGINGDNSDNWYLRSECPLSNPQCSSEPEPCQC